MKHQVPGVPPAAPRIPQDDPVGLFSLYWAGTISFAGSAHRALKTCQLASIHGMGLDPVVRPVQVVLTRKKLPAEPAVDNRDDPGVKAVFPKRGRLCCILTTIGGYESPLTEGGL